MKQGKEFNRIFWTLAFCLLGIQFIQATNINASLMRFFNSAGGFISFKAPSGLSTNKINFTLPSADGTNGQALKTDGAGTLSFGAAGGGASVSYFEDFEADDIANVLEFDDVSAATDLTGGSPNVTSSLETSSPLSKDASYKLSKDAADRQYEGWAFQSIGLYELEAEGPETISLRFNYATTANYVSGDVKVYVYRVGSNILESCETIEKNNDLYAAEDSGWYGCSVQPSSSDTAFRVGLMVATTNANAYDIRLDRLRFSVEPNAPNSIITPWKTFTSSFKGATSPPSKGTIDYDQFEYRRVGDSMELHGSYRHTTAGTAGSGVYTLEIPDGYQIDTAKVHAASGIDNGTVGSMQFGAGENFGLATAYSSTELGFAGSNTSGANTQWSSSFQAFSNANMRFSFHATVPIVGWEAGNVLSSASADMSTSYASADRSTAQSIGSGSSVTIIFNSENADQHGSYNTASGEYTPHKKGRYIFSFAATLTTASGWNAAEEVRIGIFKNGSEVKRTYKKFIPVTQSYTSILAHGTAILDLEPTDTITIRLFQNNGAAINLEANAVTNYFDVVALPNFELLGVNRTIGEAVIRDIKAVGVDGGTNTISTWTDRTLNDIESIGGFVSLSSNQFTLTAGTYHIYFAAPASGVNNHQARLYNVTDSSVTRYGMSSYTARGGNLGDDLDTVSIGSAIVTIADPKTFEIEHNTAFQHTDEGYGRATGFSGTEEVYTTVIIRKVK